MNLAHDGVPPPPSPNRGKEQRIRLLIVSVVLLVFSILLSIFELYYVNNDIMAGHGWGNIPFAALPWMFSISLSALVAILVGAVALVERKT